MALPGSLDRSTGGVYPVSKDLREDNFADAKHALADSERFLDITRVSAHRLRDSI